MKHLLFLLLICTAIAIPKPASANTEPGAYDTRSVALGLTGVAYLDPGQPLWRSTPRLWKASTSFR